MTLSSACKELLSLHEMFRRLGFPAGDLYVDMHGKCGNPKCDLEIHVQFALRRGGREAPALFTVDIWEDCSTVGSDWVEALRWWNANASTPEVEQIYKNSVALANAFPLLMALEAKGLVHKGKAT